MKLWVMSDLHWEFHADGGASFLKSLPDVTYDVAVIPGDICSFTMIGETYKRLADRFSEVVVTIGNHECYGSSIGNTVEAAQNAASGLSNLHFLEQGEFNFLRRRIHGAALWFPYSGRTVAEDGMNDFWQIRRIREEVDSSNRCAVSYLETYVKSGDIVLTHHLPSVHSVAEQYADSPLNQFFVGAAAHIFEKEPACHVHGHTHASVDVMVNKTRVVCNPFGYVGHDVNAEFNPGLVIEV